MSVDPDLAAQEVDGIDPHAEQLPQSQAGTCGQQDSGSVLGRDGVGEGEHLFDAERHDLRALPPLDLDTGRRGVDPDQPVVNSSSLHRAQPRQVLGSRRGGVPPLHV